MFEILGMLRIHSIHGPHATVLNINNFWSFNLIIYKFKIAKYVTSHQGEWGGHTNVTICDKGGIPKIMKFVCRNLWMAP